MIVSNTSYTWKKKQEKFPREINQLANKLVSEMITLMKNIYLNNYLVGGKFSGGKFSILVTFGKTFNR